MLTEPEKGAAPFLGVVIRFLRLKTGMSARALSLKAGLSPAYVFKLESGAIEPSFNNFSRIALALNMSPGEIWVCVVREVVD